MSIVRYNIISLYYSISIKTFKISKIKKITNIGKNNPMYGKKRPDLTLKNKSGVNAFKGIPIIINDVNYNSIQEAMKILNLSYYKLRKIIGKRRRP